MELTALWEKKLRHFSNKIPYKLMSFNIYICIEVQSDYSTQLYHKYYFLNSLGLYINVKSKNHREIYIRINKQI
jgi:hypothetical protein